MMGSIEPSVERSELFDLAIKLEKPTTLPVDDRRLRDHDSQAAVFYFKTTLTLSLCTENS